MSGVGEAAQRRGSGVKTCIIRINRRVFGFLTGFITGRLRETDSATEAVMNDQQG